MVSIPHRCDSPNVQVKLYSTAESVYIFSAEDMCTLIIKVTEGISIKSIEMSLSEGVIVWMGYQHFLNKASHLKYLNGEVGNIPILINIYSVQRVYSNRKCRLHRKYFLSFQKKKQRHRFSLLPLPPAGSNFISLAPVLAELAYFTIPFILQVRHFRQWVSPTYKWHTHIR